MGNVGGTTYRDNPTPVSGGRIVHVNDAIGVCQSAIVINADPVDGVVTANVFRALGPIIYQGVTYALDPINGQRHATWHWPERIEW